MSATDGETLPPVIRTLRQALAARRWRGLLWLSGPAEACHARAAVLWSLSDTADGLWVAPACPAGVDPTQWLPAGKARTRLGGEQDMIVFDAVSADAGFDPDAFGALSGTLRAGGLLVLMTPEHWGVRPDADYRRLAEHPHAPEALSSRYLQRLASRLDAAPEVARWGAGQPPAIPSFRAASRHDAIPTPADTACLTEDQADAVARLVSLRRRRPLVMTADRGRGKTAALGIACARLLAQGVPDILVTAPRPAAVAGLFERLQAMCPEGERQGHRFTLGDGRVSFVAPDELQARIELGEAGGAGRWLLVDEAAAIPAGLLGAWLGAFPRIAFATTVHGYEGAGRGFALRFRERLDRLAPQWRACHLATPVRWAPGDPLEALTARLLMLDAEPGDATASPLHWREESRQALSRNEPRLRSIFGLLVQAHYRTTPADLRRLLDAPSGRVVSLSSDAASDVDIAAVALTSDEGGFDAPLAEQVARGERRPRGHLLAQSLAAHAGERAALTAHLRRLVRIAVHAGCRRQGLGARLVVAEAHEAAAQGLDLLGVSFGAEPGLLAFWQAQGFEVVRLGMTRETATGEHALMMLRPLNAHGEALTARLRQRFQRQLPGLLAFELATLEPALLPPLLASGRVPARLSPEDRRDLEDMAHGYRDASLVRPAIQALIIAMAAGTETQQEVSLLAAWAFQGRSDAWLARQLSLPGARQVAAWRRRIVAAWLPMVSAEAETSQAP